MEIGRTTEGGFDHGFLVIQGFDKFLGKIVQVLYHNENLVAHYTEGEDTSIVVDQVLATTPDIIAGLNIIPILFICSTHQNVHYNAIMLFM